MRTPSVARIDYSPNRPCISPRSPPQSAGNQPFFTHRWKLLHGANPSDISVLHRIEVDVIDVTLEVRVVADCVLPKPAGALVPR